MCNYESDMESVLQCDTFLFGLNDQAFISKIISEESPELTAATIRQKLKKLEAGGATAKYIKGTNMTVQKVSTKSTNKPNNKPKGKREKVGAKIHTTHKTILQKNSLNQTRNMGNHVHMGTNSRSQNPSSLVILAPASVVVTHGTDKDLIAQLQSINAENATNMAISLVNV